MEDPELQTAYQSALSRRPRPPDCPSPEALDRLARRDGTEPDRLAAFDHVMACAACRQEFELLRSVYAPWRSEGRAAPRSTANARWLAAAAVVIIGIGVATILPRLRDAGSGLDPERGGPATTVVLLEPANAVRPGTAIRFAWRPVPEALSYDVEILDSADDVVAGATVTDTAWTLPDTVALRSGTGYRWWVAATTRSGGQVRSSPRRLELDDR